jgi:urease beta subunit
MAAFLLRSCRVIGSNAGRRFHVTLKRNMSNPANATEATFERTLHVDGFVYLDVATHSGVIRIEPGDDGAVTLRGVLRGRRGMFGIGGAEEHLRQLRGIPVSSRTATACASAIRTTRRCPLA